MELVSITRSCFHWKHRWVCLCCFTVILSVLLRCTATTSATLLLLLLSTFDRLHLFRCSTSEISWSWYTQRTSWKCRISKRRCFY